MSTMQQYYGTVRYTAVTFRWILVKKGKNGKNLNKKMKFTSMAPLY